MRIHITDRAIKSLKPPAKGSKIYPDDNIPGFGARITSAGILSFVLNYYIHGRERRYTIGRYPEWTSEAARDEAIYWRRKIGKGADPLGIRHKDRTGPTVDDLADDYLEHHSRPQKRESSQKRDVELLDNRIRPALGAQKVNSVTRRDIERVKKSMSDVPYQANRVLALLSKMFSLAVHWEWCDKNIVKGVPRYPEEKRERFLNNTELSTLVNAFAAYPVFTTKAGEEKVDARKEQSTNILRLLLLTGARRSEVMSAKWEQFDLEAGVWTKPSAHTKQKKTHRIPLSAPAVQLLTDIRKGGNGSSYVFPGTTPNTHQTEIKGAWAAICKLAKINNLRIHDLRHSYASQLASSGLSLPIIGALLGHTQPQTTARYAHLLDDPLRQATEKVGATIKHAETGKTAEVVSISQSKD